MKVKKQDLLCGLVKAIDDKVELVSSDAQSNAGGASFDPGAHWNILEYYAYFVNESMLIKGGVFHAPTVPEVEPPSVRKRNYSNEFD